jgi:hypothetical protein
LMSSSIARTAPHTSSRLLGRADGPLGCRCRHGHPQVAVIPSSCRCSSSAQRDSVRSRTTRPIRSETTDEASLRQRRADRAHQLRQRLTVRCQISAQTASSASNEKGRDRIRKARCQRMSSNRDVLDREYTESD